ncbi:MAG TPA: class I SAM-dependent methyltransferase [Candidatus Saccharimonadales bacterium]|nr:class I SAM-dependent methyltransferase [Candidatus Saccharimonadales bacterium]
MKQRNTLQKQVSSKIYDKNYYLSVCLGSEEFKKSKGQRLHPRVKHLLDSLPITSVMKVLDLGCGRGDISLFLAKKAGEVIGIDYSKDAIDLANEIKSSADKGIKNNVKFLRQDANALSFSENFFDAAICIDLFEHLYPAELNKVMKELKRVLKPNGLLFVHTGTNKLLYNYTYPLYILPVNKFLTSIDRKIKHVSYPPLPDDPRTREEKIQHVNEPTLGYLKELFREHEFNGSIKTEIGYVKNGKSMRTRLYNFLTVLYPLSKIYPISNLFGWVFICSMRNKKTL